LVGVLAIAQASKTVNVTCEQNKIKVDVNPVQLSLTAKETVRWIFSGKDRDKSVGACKVQRDNVEKSLKDWGLAKIEIALLDVRDLLQLNPPVVDWEDGKDSSITGTPLKVGESKYSIKFLDKDGKVLHEVKEASVLTVQVTPTLTEWGLIALAVLLAGGMGYMIYRRRPALRPAAP
jgi:uncharacterized 2Fe-2S/4Fe-4S cluster protein (DUF4445 family)